MVLVGLTKDLTDVDKCKSGRRGERCRNVCEQEITQVNVIIPDDHLISCRDI